MSRETRDRAWAHSQCKRSQLALLLALAERADASGVCWPSHSELEKRCRVKERQIQNLLGHIEAAGEILSFCAGGRRKGGNGQGQGNLYVVTVGMDERMLALVLQNHPELQKRGLTMSATEAENCARSVAERSANREHERSEKADIDQAQERVIERRQKPNSQAQRVQKIAPLNAPKGAMLRSQRVQCSTQKGAEDCTLKNDANKDTHARFEPSENRHIEPSECTRASAQEVFSHGDPLLLSVLRVCEADERWAMGTVSAKFQHDLHKLMSWLKQQGRGPDDIKAYASALPTFLNKPAAQVTPPTPGQMLDNFDRVLRIAHSNTNSNRIEKANGTYQPNSSAAEKRGSALAGYLDDLTERRADIERRERELAANS